MTPLELGERLPPARNVSSSAPPDLRSSAGVSFPRLSGGLSASVTLTVAVRPSSTAAVFVVLLGWVVVGSCGSVVGFCSLDI